MQSLFLLNFISLLRIPKPHFNFYKSTMNKLLAIFALFVLISCGTKPTTKVPCFAWVGGPCEATDIELKANFTDLKEKGIDGLMYNGGHDPSVYQRVGKIAKEAGLEFHTWIPTMVQGRSETIRADL